MNTIANSGQIKHNHNAVINSRYQFINNFAN